MGMRIAEIVALSEALGACPDVDGMLALLVDRLAPALDVRDLTIRILDVSGVVLATQARAGHPFHHNAGFEFVLGEGLVGWVAKHLEPLRVARAEDDPRFSPRPDQERPMGAYLGVPLRDGDRCLGVISAVSDHEGHFTAEHEALVRMIAAFAAPHLLLARLRRTAGPDPVTLVTPATRLDPLLAALDARAPVSALWVEIDDLATLRARRGVGFADLVRRTVAAAVASTLRETDAVVQLEDAVVVAFLPAVSLPTMVHVAERARRLLVADLERHRTASPTELSIAVAERRPGEPRDELLARLRVARDEARESRRIATAR